MHDMITRMGGSVMNDILRRVGVNVLFRGHLTLAARTDQPPIRWYKDLGHCGQGLQHGDRIIDYVPILLYQGRHDNEATLKLIVRMVDEGKIPNPLDMRSSDFLDAASMSRLTAMIEDGLDPYPRGTLFQLGSEPGLSYAGDERTPAELVADAERIKKMLDGFDRDYRLALGGIATARCEASKIGYRGIYGIDYFKQVLRACGDFTFDAYVIHPHPFPSETKKPVFVDSRDQITEFRRVMAEHGLRDKPLLVGEIGIGFKGTKEDEALQFVQRIVTFMLTQRDAAIGNPKDGNFLVQRFCWWCLSPPTLLEPIPVLDHGVTSLLDENGEVTALGRVFIETVKRIAAGRNEATETEGHTNKPDAGDGR